MLKDWLQSKLNQAILSSVVALAEIAIMVSLLVHNEGVLAVGVGFVMLGIDLTAYAKANDRSENYEILIPFYLGLILLVAGVVILAIKFLVS